MRYACLSAVIRLYRCFSVFCTVKCAILNLKTHQNVFGNRAPPVAYRALRPPGWIKGSDKGGEAGKEELKGERRGES